MNARSTFSSQRPGHEAACAVDNFTGAWWEPAVARALHGYSIGADASSIQRTLECG